MPPQKKCNTLTSSQPSRRAMTRSQKAQDSTINKTHASLKKENETAPQETNKNKPTVSKRIKTRAKLLSKAILEENFLNTEAHQHSDNNNFSTPYPTSPTNTKVNEILPESITKPNSSHAAEINAIPLSRRTTRSSSIRRNINNVLKETETVPNILTFATDEDVHTRVGRRGIAHRKDTQNKTKEVNIENNPLKQTQVNLSPCKTEDSNMSSTRLIEHNESPPRRSLRRLRKYEENCATSPVVSLDPQNNIKLSSFLTNSNNFSIHSTLTKNVQASDSPVTSPDSKITIPSDLPRLLGSEPQPLHILEGAENSNNGHINERSNNWVDTTIDDDLIFLDKQQQSESDDSTANKIRNSSTIVTDSHDDASTDKTLIIANTSKTPTIDATSLSDFPLVSDTKLSTSLEANITCDYIRDNFEYMPYTSPPTQQELKAANQLPLPIHLSDMLRLFQALEHAIQQRRQRHQPLLWNTAPLGNVSLQEHSEQLCGKKFHLSSLRQIAWIAPHLIGLDWAPIKGPQHQGRQSYDLEIQQKLFHVNGPVHMTFLKQREIDIRADAFRFSCIQWVLLRHNEYLKTHDPPIPSIPLHLLSQWHPAFHLEKDILTIPLMSLPSRNSAIQLTPVRQPHRGVSPISNPFNLGILATLTPLRLGTSPTPTRLGRLTPDRRMNYTAILKESEGIHSPSTPIKKIFNKVEHDGYNVIDPETPMHHYTPNDSSPSIFKGSPIRYATPMRHKETNDLHDKSPILRDTTPTRYGTSILKGSPIRCTTPIRYATPVRYVTPVRSNYPNREQTDHTTSPTRKIENHLKHPSDSNTVRTPFRSRTPIGSTTTPPTNRQLLLQKADKKKNAKYLETLIQNDLHHLDINVEEIEDSLACLEGIVKVFLRNDGVPLAQLETLVRKVLDAVQLLYPNLTLERTRAGILNVHKKTKGVITIRRSKCCAGAQLVQFHKNARIAAEKEKLLEELDQVKHNTEKLKQNKLEELCGSLLNFPITNNITK